MPQHSWPAVEAPSTLDPAAAAAALPAVDDALLAAAVAAVAVAPLAAGAVAVVYVLGLLQLLDNPCEILNKIELLQPYH